MTDEKSGMDLLADFIKSGRHQTEPIPAEVREKVQIWLDQERAKALATYQDPMLPPWLYMPDVPALSIGWRMGPGEDYWLDFRSWFLGLLPEEKQSYSDCYREPRDWTGFYGRLEAQA
jgi:hypothetical protein